MSMVRGQYSQVLALGLHHLFIQWNDLLQAESEFDKVFNIEASDSAYEDEIEYAGGGPMVEKPESEAINYTALIEGPSVRFMHSTFALGVRASFELIEDDKYNLIRQAPKTLTRSANFRKEQDCANIFNLGFTTVTSNDGVSLFNSAHPLLGGAAATTLGPGVSGIIASAGTYPNRPATDMDISQTSLQLGIRHFERLIDAVGFPVALRPAYLWIPPELIFVAIEYLASPNRPGTANNEVNALLRQGLQFQVGKYLTSPTAWGLLCEKQFHQLKFFDRKPLTEDYSDDFDTLSVKNIAYCRYSVGAASWLGTWGTTP